MARQCLPLASLQLTLSVGGKKRYQALWESVCKGWLVLVVFFPSHLMTQLIVHSDVLLAVGQVLLARRPDDKVFIHGGRSPTLLLLVFSWGAWHSCLLSPGEMARLPCWLFWLRAGERYSQMQPLTEQKLQPGFSSPRFWLSEPLEASPGLCKTQTALWFPASSVWDGGSSLVVHC